jgi:2-oxoglutarate ferredoxin oxidoreductase subunit beta
MNKKGFSFIEVMTPCPSSFGRRNRMGTGLDLLKFYHDRSVIMNGIDPKDAPLDFANEIIVGRFVNIERPTFMDNYRAVQDHQIASWPPPSRKTIREPLEKE